MSRRNPRDHATLLKQAKLLDAMEARLQKNRKALADELLAAAIKLGAEVPVPAYAPRPKRKKRKARVHAQKPPSAVSALKPENPTMPSGSHGMRSGGWTETVYGIVATKPGGTPYSDLKSEVARTPLGPRLERQDKSFYGALLKLEKSGKIVRHKGRAYTPESFEAFRKQVEAGIIADTPPKGSHAGQSSPTKLALLELLRQKPGGIPRRDVVKRLRRIPELELNDKKSLTAAYNLLARLIKREEVDFDGRIVRLPRSANGASKVEAPDSGELSGAPNGNGKMPLFSMGRA